MRNQVFKKLFSVLLALIMVAGLLPASVLAEGEGNADSTPAPTEAVQPTESAEPTAPTETETPEVTEVPEPTPENPAATVEPTQGEPTAEPTEEITIAPVNEVVAQAANTETDTSFTVDETNAKTRESVGSVNYRAVMLDCGRKYFSVKNIEKLIDTMAQYGYNQLQLSFGNGGCRFLLDDMSLSFKDVTMVSDTVRTNITNGNYSFNSDERYLSQTDMDAIITYAVKKGIEIVPMLNMPGHATAIVYNTSYSSSGNLIINNETSRYYGYALLKKYAEYFAGKGCKYFSFGADESGYTGDNMTKFLTGCANVIVGAGMIPRAFNDATNGATMPKTVQITYWHIETNSKSASALANDGYEMINTHGRWYYVIKTAQNSEKDTKYWQGKVRTTETSVELPVMKATKMDNGTWVGLNEYFDANPGYGSTINTSKGTMFCIWCDASQDTYLTDSDVISENENYGALYQLEKLAEHYWPEDIKKTTAPVVKTESGTAVPTTMTANGRITLTANESVAWTTSDASVIKLISDASVIKLISATNADGDTITGTTVTAVAVGAGKATITATNNAGKTARYTINVQDAAAATTNNVSLKVGETSDPYTVTGDVTEGEQIIDDNKYIATAKVTTGGATAAKVEKVTSIESGKKYLITNYRNDILLTNTASTYTVNYANYYDALKLEGSPNTDSMQKWTFTGTVANNVYTGTVSSSDGKYLSVGLLTASTKDAEQNLTLSYNTDNSCWTIAQGNYYLNQLGGKDSRVAGGYTDGASDPGSRWHIYEITEASEGGSKLTITGTGEGVTEVKVGDTNYKITVTAPEKAETVTVEPRSSVTLHPTIPTGGTVTYTLEDGNNQAGVTLAETGVVTTGEKTGNAIVKAVVKNAGEKVVAYYTYTITVSDIDWANATPLPVELWITNTTVGVAAADNITTESRNGKQVWTVKVSAQSAYKEEGVLLGSLVPYNGYKSDNREVKTVYWKGTVQTTVPQPQGNDLSYAGTDFTRVRYWNNAWQYQVNDNWQNFDLATNSNNTVVAFYLQISDVSPEITTGTQHYGNPPTNDPGYSGNGFTMTTFAVVYPDGTLSRTEQQMYEKGMIRGFWGGTSINIGTVYAENNSTYKVSKITVTWGKNILGSSGSDWYTNGQTGTYGTNWGVKWDKVTNSAGDEWYKETTYWKDGDSERPMVDGNALNLNLTTEKNAVLILIYLEVVQTEDTLSIVYWDDNGNKQITTNPMPIPVVVNSDVTFLKSGETGIQQTSTVSIGMFTLDDDAYILNSSGAKQGFNKNLSTVPGVTGVYMSGMYQYVSAEISNDGKTLTLHFDLKSATKEKTFVADFGLPLVVAAKEFDITNIESINSMSLEKNKITMEAQGNYGRATIANDYSKVTYELNKMLNGKATIPLYVTFKDGTSTLEFQVHIIPATSVYYEDSFAKFTNGSYNGGAIAWEDAGTKPQETPTQALEALGDKTNHKVYGYDPAYDKCTMFSMGSAHKVNVTSDMATTGVVWPTAQFTFKGTGFDIISLTNNTSGGIFVDIYEGKEATGERLKSYVVNNYYGYKYENGEWVTSANDPNTIYQVPVIKVRDLEYKEYTVVIEVCYNAIFDTAKQKQTSFWLDAVRVYDPAGNTLDNDYVKDREVKPIYVEVRKALIGQGGFTADGSGLTNGAVFIDGKSTGASIADYKNFGPNHEVYLAKDQAIAFRIVADRKPDTVQIGVKLANGSNGTLKIGGGNEVKFAAYSNVNASDTLTLSTATDMYYALDGITWTVDNGSQKSNIIVLTNTGDNSIVSITNVKCTYASITENTTNAVTLAISYDDALMAVDAVNSAITPVEPEPEPEPEKTFEPERFEASWSRNVMQGRKATLTVKTSEDVEAITVDGQTIRSYRTRTERVGIGRRAKRITYREFTYSMVAQESADFSVTAINAEGTESEAITARLTVKTRPNSMRDMWNWFKGWF